MHLYKRDLYTHGLSWMMNPFRQSLEVVDGKARTEFGCYTEKGDFRWTPLSADMIDAIGGNHHIKVSLYTLWSASTMRPRKFQRDLSVKEFFCQPTTVRMMAGCEGSNNIIILRNRNIKGMVLQDEPHSCR